MRMGGLWRARGWRPTSFFKVIKVKRNGGGEVVLGFQWRLGR